jgi:predicted nucleic acid-binding protein
MKRTYVDSGVLTRAARGVESLSASAIALLCDPGREFVCSEFVRLELLARSAPAETQFYETYFRQVAIWASMEPHLWTTAVSESRATGLAPLDALHVVLAATTGCDELVTTQASDAAIYKTKRVTVVGLV